MFFALPTRSERRASSSSTPMPGMPKARTHRGVCPRASSPTTSGSSRTCGASGGFRASWRPRWSQPTTCGDIGAHRASDRYARCTRSRDAEPCSTAMSPRRYPPSRRPHSPSAAEEIATFPMSTVATSASLIPVPVHRIARRRPHPYGANDEGLLDEVEAFLTGVRPKPLLDRVLATVLFTDIVGVYQRLAQLGDRRWRVVLDEHHTACPPEFGAFPRGRGQHHRRRRSRFLRRAGTGPSLRGAIRDEVQSPRHRHPPPACTRERSNVTEKTWPG